MILAKKTELPLTNDEIKNITEKVQNALGKHSSPSLVAAMTKTMLSVMKKRKNKVSSVLDVPDVVLDAANTPDVPDVVLDVVPDAANTPDVAPGVVSDVVPGVVSDVKNVIQPPVAEVINATTNPYGLLSAAEIVNMTQKATVVSIDSYFDKLMRGIASVIKEEASKKRSSVGFYMMNTENVYDFGTVRSVDSHGTATIIKPKEHSDQIIARVASVFQSQSGYGTRFVHPVLHVDWMTT